MAEGDTRSLKALGFLTVLEHEVHGLLGGYLVLNRAGRPLEFHCTTPVRPNRAQEILYGATLKPYLYGELIGPTLVSKAKARAVAICTDQQAVLAARGHVKLPLALVIPPEQTESSGSETSGDSHRLDSAHSRAGFNPRSLRCFELGEHRLAVSTQSADDEQSLLEMQSWICELDLLEPFERIRQAIEEAGRGGG